MKHGLLKSDVVGMLGAVTLGVVMLSPAMTLYGNFGPTYLSAGRAAPWAFVLALLATLPTAISYAFLSRGFPNSGSASSWITRSTSPTVGEWAGWIVFLYYFNNFIIQPVTLGVFLNDLLTTAGFHASFATFALGTLACCAWPAWIAYRGIAPSTKGALAFLLFESLVVAALCLTAGIVGPTPEAAAAVAQPQALAGGGGIAGAMIFAMLAFCGFDVISTLSEEAKMARRLVPQATFLAIVLFGGFIIAGIAVLARVADPIRLKAVADAGGMPISELARQYWGKGALLVPITAISASLGISIAASVGASRVLFSMSRDGLAPRAFAKLHEGYSVPWNAMHLIFGLGFAVALLTGAVLGPYQSYVWWGTTSTYFAMVTYLGVNFASFALHREQAFKSAAHFLVFVAIPLAGIAVDGYILVRSFFMDLWAQPGLLGRGVVYFDVACTLLAMALAARSAMWRGTRQKLPVSDPVRSHIM